jgi:hypothetical protein
MHPSIKVEAKVKEARKLSSFNRCDACGVGAYVQVTGVTGDLSFCAHHYTKIINNPKAKAKMEAFAFEVVDERDFLLKENRTQGED